MLNDKSTIPNTGHHFIFVLKGQFRERPTIVTKPVTNGNKNKAKLGKATAGEKSLRANTKLQKLQSKSTNVSPPPQKKKLPRSFANCRSYACSKKCPLSMTSHIGKN